MGHSVVTKVTPLFASMQFFGVPKQVLYNQLLPLLWMHECEVEGRTNPVTGKQTFAIKHRSAEDGFTRYLRMSDEQNWKDWTRFWDQTGTWFPNVDHALLELSRSPAPPGAQSIQTYGKDPTLQLWWVERMERLHGRTFDHAEPSSGELDLDEIAASVAQEVVATLLVTAFRGKPRIARLLAARQGKVVQIVTEAMHKAKERRLSQHSPRPAEPSPVQREAAAVRPGNVFSISRQ